jgi:hypothetical protein
LKSQRIREKVAVGAAKLYGKCYALDSLYLSLVGRNEGGGGGRGAGEEDRETGKDSYNTDKLQSLHMYNQPTNKSSRTRAER